MGASAAGRDQDHRRQLVADALHRSDESMTINEIAARCGTSISDTSNALAALERDSRVHLDGRRWSSSRRSGR